MLYCFICRDGVNAPRIREEFLKDHLDHIERVWQNITVAGPVPAEDGGYEASIIMIEADNEQAAWDLFNQDPYAQQNVWDSIDMLPFKAVAGKWVGGITWK